MYDWESLGDIEQKRMAQISIALKTGSKCKLQFLQKRDTLKYIFYHCRYVRFLEQFGKDALCHSADLFVDGMPIHGRSAIGFEAHVHRLCVELL